MSCDKLVYDLSQEVEGSPNVFIRKDWLNIMDNQNQNYQNNQSIIDTSQLSNSNKFMSYREAYLAMPMTLSFTQTYQNAAGGALQNLPDFSVGLKNWFGTIIHSMTLDYNGTTIVQQTPFCNLWNSFKLLTTFSWADVVTQGSTIGFYPDTPDAYALIRTGADNGSQSGKGLTNNNISFVNSSVPYKLQTNTYTSINPYVDEAGIWGSATLIGNEGLGCRIKWIAYDPDAQYGSETYGSGAISDSNSKQVWKSLIYNKYTSAANIAPNTNATIQIAIMATIYLKHVHSFFNMCPLLKGAFMKLTFNLNNTTVTTRINEVVDSAAPTGKFTCQTSNTFVGGVCPILIPSISTGSYDYNKPVANSTGVYNLTVGARVYENGIVGGTNAPLAQSVYLYIPAYTFNPTFETAYLSNSVKQIKYTDIYQYQFDIEAIGAGGAAVNFNQLITNGIANIKSILIIPVAKVSCGNGLGANTILQYQSPFDPCGGGTTCPFVSLANFNVQISGQNAIYNNQRYTFEEWNNQLYGENAVNGGLTDGLTSGLIDFNGFSTGYSYYYLNVERMLPVEQAVPKSVQVMGTSYCPLPLRFMVFIEYGTSINIDVLTGARV